MIEKSNLDDYKIKYSYIKNNICIGSVLVEDAIDIINIIDVMVDLDNRRHGIASKLLNEVIDDYKNRSVKFMLEVREDNIPALKLYEKFDFKVIHIRKKYYKNKDALIMEKSGKL